jgi:hypothetical protein
LSSCDNLLVYSPPLSSDIRKRTAAAYVAKDLKPFYF